MNKTTAVLCAFSFVATISVGVQAEKTKTVFNPFTSKLDFITALDASSILSGSGISVSCSVGVCTITATGGAAANLETLANGVRISSPTASIGLTQGAGLKIVGNLAGGATASYLLYLDPAATNYIQNTSSNQSAIYSVSSGTVLGQLTSKNLRVTGSNTTTANIALGELTAAGHNVNTLDLYDVGSKVGSFGYDSALGLIWRNGADEVLIKSQPGANLYGTYNLSVGSITLRNVASGTQCLQADGSGNVTGSGAACGTGTGSGIVSPGTFTWTNNFGMSLSTVSVTSGPGLTVTYGATVGSMTVSGTGAGVLDLQEGSGPVGISGHDLLYGDSSTAWLKMNPSSTTAYLVAGSSTTGNGGSCAQFSADGSLIKAPLGACGGPFLGSNYAVQFSSVGVPAGATGFNVFRSSVMVEAPLSMGASSMTVNSSTTLNAIGQGSTWINATTMTLYGVYTTMIGTSTVPYIFTVSTGVGGNYYMAIDTSGVVSANNLTISGSGAGTFSLLEGAAPSGQANSDVIWADSTAHWAKMIPNNGQTYLVVGSSSTPTAGHLAAFSASGSLVDGGTGSGGGGGGGIVSPGSFTWQNTFGMAFSTITVSSNTVMPGTTIYQDIATGGYINLTSTGTANALKVVANGTYGTSTGSSGGMLLDCSGGSTGSGMCMQIVSNAGAQSALGGMLNIMNTGTGWNEPALYAKRTSTNNNSDIRLDAASTPAITLDETSQPTGSAQKFQWSAHNGTQRLEARKTDDSGFDSKVVISSMASSGGMFIGSGYGTAVSTLDVAGNLTVGGTKAGVTAAPLSGALIEGQTLTSGGLKVSSGIVLSPNTDIITTTMTLTSSMTVVEASCTTRNKPSAAWITLTLPQASVADKGQEYMIYDVGTDSCSIRVAANGAEEIESTGVVKLDAYKQHAALHAMRAGGWAGGLGGIQFTPWSIYTTQDDVQTFTVATSSQVTKCPIYVPVPIALTGFRVDRVNASLTVNNASVAIFGQDGKYIIGLSTQTLANSYNNLMLSTVYNLAPGWYYLGVTLANTTMSISGSNGVNDTKMFCNRAASPQNLDLSQVTLTVGSGSPDNSAYPAVDLLFNGGVQGF